MLIVAAVLLAASATASFGQIDVQWPQEGGTTGHGDDDGSRRAPSVILPKAAEEEADDIDDDDEEDDENDENGEPSVRSAAFEDAWWRNGHATDTQADWFGSSPEPRTPRPAKVQFSIGQVYRHAHTGSRGVIVGWDARTRAPRQWVEMNQGQLGASFSRLNAPHYSVIEEVDEDANGRPSKKGEMSFMMRYIIGDFMRVLDDGFKVEPLRFHPDVARHFGSYNSNTGRYTPLPWLRERYPHG